MISIKSLRKYFVLNLALDQIILYTLYKYLLFRCIPNWSYCISDGSLLCMIAVAFITSLVLYSKKSENCWQYPFIAFSPYGIYTFVCYHKLLHSHIIVSLLLALTVTIIYIVINAYRMLRNKRIRTAAVKTAIKAQVLFVCSMCLCSAVVMVYLGFRVATGNNLYDSRNNYAAAKPLSYDVSVDNNGIGCFQKKTWENLSITQKVSAAQMICDIEAKHLGLPTELIIGVSVMEEGKAAYYRDDTMSVYININFIENGDPVSVLKTICHEVYHSYQYRQIDAYENADEGAKNLMIYEKARVYSDEFKNYVDCKEDVKKYSEQQCEKDCNEYARMRYVNFYYYYLVGLVTGGFVSDRI